MATTVPPLPTADLAAGLTAAFGICAAVLGRVTSGEGTYLDVSMTDVLATWTGPAGAGHDGRGSAAGSAGAHARLRALRHGRRRAGGARRAQRAALLVAACARSSDWASLAALGFDERCRRGAELQHAIGAAIATRPRDELVTRLVAAGVPVAPVLDRQGMLAAAPFPRFPIRLPLPGAARTVPTLDQHRGEGFAGPG